ncbi:Uncharacterized protein TCM_045202 [Theobroma cacao]|uniref:ATPase AAA-type core domain-containing protein n=1 Tax=Theobroma cacao TaxID=3641 RepID=A0A061FSZ4_THECC|nr:Uncharacterized protein TCM_045202 [Theobroma cacao]
MVSEQVGDNEHVGEGLGWCEKFSRWHVPKKHASCSLIKLTLLGCTFDDGVGGDNEEQRTMFEIVNQLDGFDARGAIKVLMATNRPDTLDPANF